MVEPSARMRAEETERYVGQLVSFQRSRGVSHEVQLDGCPGYTECYQARDANDPETGSQVQVSMEITTFKAQVWKIH